jgi:pyruvate ferredoxin oxidoreductase beta subunit
MRSEEKERRDYFHGGHFLCPGCTGGTLWRAILQVLGKNCIVASGATCSNLPLSVYPTNVEVPGITISMASPAALLSGMRTALDVLEKKGRRKRKEKVHLVAIVGDGATADIGFATLSGAAERNVDAIYVCFDNEAYMNTGIQRSSQTPMLAWTTTTLAGKQQQKKNLPAIMAAHGIPYVATATVGFHDDLVRKLMRARDMGPGFKYIHVLSPCPPGWRFPESKAIELARLAVETGLWVLFEMENGRMMISHRPLERRPVKDYLSLQGRFSSLTSKQIAQMQKDVDKKWADLPK